MKAIKFSEDQFECLIEDAIFYEDNSFKSISGNATNGFVVEESKNIENILKNGWSELYPALEDKSQGLTALAGETSWGGTGFVALRVGKTNTIKWLIHLSTMNNPTNIKIEEGTIILTTDLNPKGIDFVIPIDRPENFKIESPAANKV